MILQTNFFLKDKEVSGEKYEEMLGCVPPIAMVSNAFLVGEASDHVGENNQARYALYFEDLERFYSGGLVTLKQFQTFLV